MSPPTNSDPNLSEAKPKKGIIGGMLILEQRKAKDLFSPKIAAKERVIRVWNPQKGAMPKKSPKATEQALLLWEALLSKRSSLRH